MACPQEDTLCHPGSLASPVKRVPSIHRLKEPSAGPLARAAAVPISDTHAKGLHTTGQEQRAWFRGEKGWGFKRGSRHKPMTEDKDKVPALLT